MSNFINYMTSHFPIEEFISFLKLMTNSKSNIKNQMLFFKYLDIKCKPSLENFFTFIKPSRELEISIKSFLDKLKYIELTEENNLTILNILCLAYLRDLELKSSLSSFIVHNTKSFYGLFLHTSKGAGGDESMFFLKEYEESYVKFLNQSSIKKSKQGIYRIGNLSYNNSCALYSALLEGPVIRVQREPDNGKGKIHTSTVVFLPVFLIIPEEAEDLVRHLTQPEMIEFDVFRSSGAGGQHVNKTESAVRAKHKILDIVCISRDERSQVSNKKTAVERMTIQIRNNLQESISGSIYKHFVSADRSMKSQTFNYKRDQISYHGFSFSTRIDTFFSNPKEYFDKLWLKILHTCAGL